MTGFNPFGMRWENVRQLLDTFPALFRSYSAMADTLEAAGPDSPISCGHGRFALVYDLSRDIETAAQSMGLDRHSSEWPQVIRIADTLGRLEFDVLTQEVDDVELTHLFVNGTARPLVHSAFRQLIMEAEHKSTQICDSCGQPGTLKGAHTYCDWCAGERARMQSEEDEIMAEDLKSEFGEQEECIELREPTNIVEQLAPSKLDDIIKLHRDQFSLTLATQDDLGLLPCSIRPGHIVATLGDWRIIVFTIRENGGGLVKDKVMFMTGIHQGKQCVWMTSPITAIDIGNSLVFTKNNTYKLGNKGDGEPGTQLLIHICVVLNDLGLGEMLGIPHFFY